MTNSVLPLPTKKMERPAPSYPCIYCNISFTEKADLRAHCQSEMHEMMVMSDEGHDWFWRAPPRGFKSDTYILCQNWKDTGSCRYGIQCVQAHGTEELIEWKERFCYREMKLQRAKEKELFGKSYTEELLEKWVQCSNPGILMCEHIEEVEDHCSCPLSVTVPSKNSYHNWTFLIKTRKPLKAVALLQDTHRTHFYISSIFVKNAKVELKNDQEWISPLCHQESYAVVHYRITVMFKTNIFGTFRQSVVFDFTTEPVLVKHLCVDLVPESEVEKLNEIRKEITLSIDERWTTHNSDIIQFQPNFHSEWENKLLSLYPCPRNETFVLSHSTINDKKFTRNNYRERMHELILVEEMARYDLIAQYNLTTRLQMAHNYILSPNNVSPCTTKYSSNGELFAVINLGKELSEDTCEGRQILMNCNSVYLCPVGVQALKRRVYEALIEDKGKNTIYLRLSGSMVSDLKLVPDSGLKVQIQFRLNRLPYCQLHYTLDKIVSFKAIFPEMYLEPVIPWSPTRQWNRNLDRHLNVRQKEAVLAITTPLCVQLPPILVIGPYGTGKTFTLAQAIKNLIKDPSNRILLCTHSNSAADLYIKDYFDKWVQEGEENAKPLRIYYEGRWVTTVSSVVLKYCITKSRNGVTTFCLPNLDELMEHKIVVVTLSTSIHLSTMCLPPGFFTHILLDEAAQAMEPETMIPLALATEHTRIVLAGDHMQLGPEILSSFAKERNLHVSLLERLYDLYPIDYTCKILLCENYRAHKSIIEYTSESFYDQKLIASSKLLPHPEFYPLTFFTTRGEDIQDKNSTGFYNYSEVYEVVERVAELKWNWPEEWGEFTDQSIGVVTPYADQVFKIRHELRKRRIDNVCVERVLNIQGKEFRAIILSTVRTRKTCSNDASAGALDYGFLSDSKLLNTAITRARSLVAVVGDPIALCSVGRCSKVWERFIQVCNDNKSMIGLSWTRLKLQLDGIELKKVYTLNPLAPEFIPRGYLAQPVANNRPVAAGMVPRPFVTQLGMTYPPTLIYNAPARPYYHVAAITPQLIHTGYSPTVRVVSAAPSPRQNNNVPAVTKPLPAPANVVAPIAPSPPVAKTVPPSSSNNLIQFMNNVHFPDSSVLNDCINLLPQNTSLADMLLQPPTLQEKWYNYLEESSGKEAAEKFRYLLYQTNQKGSKVQDRLIFECATPQSCDSPTFNWYDSPTNQININKPVYIQSEHTNGLSNGVHKIHHGGANKSIVDCILEVDETALQRHIHEEFSRSRDVDDQMDMFKVFVRDGAKSGSGINGAAGVNVPRFYKYFQ